MLSPEPSPPRTNPPGGRGAIRSAHQPSLRTESEWAAYANRYGDPQRRHSEPPRERPAEPQLDASYDFDIPDRMRALMKSLAEHPAMRPLLRERELSYRPRSRDGRLAVCCARCNESPCRCGDCDARANDLMAAAYLDAELRPLFDAQHLMVLQ